MIGSGIYVAVVLVAGRRLCYTCNQWHQRLALLRGRAARKGYEMAAETIAKMTQSEFKEMLETVVEATVERTLLEMLGDPDEGLEIRSDVRKRLLRQRQSVTAGMDLG
jgi:hypothetical protein